MEYNVGDTIRHRVFGKGEIVSLSDSVYVIDFGDFGKRSIDKNYTGIEFVKSAEVNTDKTKNRVFILTKILRYLRKNSIDKIDFDLLVKNLVPILKFPNEEEIKSLISNNNNEVVTTDLLKYLINFYKEGRLQNTENSAKQLTLFDEFGDLNTQKRFEDYGNNIDTIPKSNANFNLVRAHSKDFDKEYYSSKYFFNKLKNYGIEESYFSKALFFLGYIAFKNYVVKSKYKNLEQCIMHEIGKNELYYYNNEFDLKEYDDAIANLVDELYLVKEDSGLYSTFNMLKKSGIDGNEVLTFKARMKEFCFENKFFSFNQLYNQFSDSKLVSYCNTAEKLIPFIGKINNISYFVTLSGDYIFGCVKSNLIKELFRSILNGQNSMDIYDIMSTIQSKFNVEYTLDDFERDINKTDYFYARTLEKIFKNKKLYYEEIYS